MSHLTYSAYPKFGQEALESTHYSQAVRLPSTGSQLHTSGQGGWDRAGNHSNVKISEDITTEVDQAFENVDATLKDAGGKGMDEVYKLVIYAAPLTDELPWATVSRCGVPKFLRECELTWIL